jgi:hypothetical protein
VVVEPMKTAEEQQETKEPRFWLWTGTDGRWHGGRLAVLSEDAEGRIETMTFQRNNGEYDHVSGDRLRTVYWIDPARSDGDGAWRIEDARNAANLRLLPEDKAAIARMSRAALG